jgi:cell division cycle protein 20 (cofactor of APC complex)
LESQKFQVSRASKADSAFTADPSKDSETLDVASFAYQSEVAKACGLALDTRILAFHEEPPVSDRAELRARYNRPIKQANNSAKASVKRKIPTMPEK